MESKKSELRKTVQVKRNTECKRPRITIHFFSGISKKKAFHSGTRAHSQGGKARNEDIVRILRCTRELDADGEKNR